MEAIGRNWTDVIKVLKLKIEASDFSFLKALGLGPKQSEVMKVAVSAAVSEPVNFPTIPDFHRRMVSQDLNTAAAWHLQKKGHLERLGENAWCLAPLFFERTGLNPIEGEDLKETEGTPKPSPARSVGFRHGSKVESFLRLLNSEMISEELQLTPELIKSWAKNLGVNDSYIRDIVRRLSGRNILIAKYLDRGHGYLLRLGGTDSAAPIEEKTEKKEVSVSDLIKRSEEVINGLKLRIETLQGKIKAEIAFLEQLRKRA